MSANVVHCVLTHLLLSGTRGQLGSSIEALNCAFLELGQILMHPPEKIGSSGAISD